LVLDASVLAATLIDDGPDGTWSRSELTGEALVAPQHVYAETANILRRGVARGLLSPELALLAHETLFTMRITLFSYRPFAERIWQLSSNVVPHDAWYVALAEVLDAPLVTLDYRLTRAPGPRCTFLTPP